MRVNLELSQLLQLLGVWAHEARGSARIQFGDRADAVILGVSHLFQHQQEALSGLAEYDLSPEPQAQLLLQSVHRYCESWCAYSREVPPGDHERCTGCPLSPFTAEVLARVVLQVMEG